MTYPPPPPPGPPPGWTPPPGPPPPGWAAPPGPPTGGGGNTPLILLLSAVVVMVVALGGVAVWWLLQPDDSTAGPVAARTSTPPQTTGSPEPTRRPRTTTAPPPSESPNAQLMALLSAGHDSSNCEPISPPAGTSIATVDCGQATSPGGPVSTRYSLFADQTALDDAFNEAVLMNAEILECPGSGVDSPTTWNYTETPDQIAGQIACGTYNDRADVVWTNDAGLLLADAQGPDLGELHNWWLQYG
ncbi:hypothetical protein [Mycolicibacterium hippocampi]|uniref:Serine/threonine protein kinase n=1 Tax=Mycolicibacterium hippocampi TaxID=659824 RepID=A0A7I9ZUS8_9MYCO|nr:hypothetical protein [Mycolicibacterium hippocampi]GFH04821.1 hypothetical protein MHIP_53040 [Mycolicibacterium hippocampi]